MRFPMLSSGDVPENGTVQKDFYNKKPRHHAMSEFPGVSALIY